MIFSNFLFFPFSVPTGVVRGQHSGFPSCCMLRSVPFVVLLLLLLTVSQFSRNFPQSPPQFPANILQFFAIGFDTPRLQSPPPPNYSVAVGEGVSCGKLSQIYWNPWCISKGNSRRPLEIKPAPLCDCLQPTVIISMQMASNASTFEMYVLKLNFLVPSDGNVHMLSGKCCSSWLSGRFDRLPVLSGCLDPPL